MHEQLVEARKRFSQRLLKDLGDEYSENYPQLQLVLARFHGLTTEYALPAIEVIVKKLASDAEIQEFCKSWIFRCCDVYSIVDLMYRIGFWGIRHKGVLHFRGVGVRGKTIPPIESGTTHVVIHPCYAAALDLQEKVTFELSETILLRSGDGMLLELPDSVTLKEHHDRLDTLLERLKNCEPGRDHDGEYEDIIGDTIKYCLYQYFSHVSEQVRSVEGRSRRDWICANIATTGFWHTIRERYQALHVVWECKNYSELSADDFQQCNYYINKAVGNCVILCFRGSELKRAYLNHIKYINDKSENGAIVIPLMDKDLKVFIRQAKNQRTRDDHIQGIYSEIIGKIS